MNDNDNYTKITLVHKGDNENIAWWNDCVVYELPFLASKSDLELFSPLCHDLVQLGISAVLVRPSKIDFSKDEDFIKDFINIFHRVGLKVIFQLSGPVPSSADKFSSPFIDFEIDSPDLIHRAEIAIKNGIDGIDLGFIIQEEMNSELSVNTEHFSDMIQTIKNLIVKSGKEIIITASASETYFDKLTNHLSSNAIQHLRNDSFIHAPFNANVFLSKIRNSYSLSNSHNFHSAWRYQSPNLLHENYPSLFSWSKTAKCVENRISALQLLFLGLPGSVYVNYFDELALPKTDRKKDFPQLLEHAKNLFEEQKNKEFSPWKSYKNALRTRAQHNMGLGTIANISGFNWANENTLVLVCEHIYIVTNMSNDNITIPSNFELIVSSSTEVEEQYTNTDSNNSEGTVLPPETTGWFRENK